MYLSFKNPLLNNLCLLFILFLPFSWASTSIGSIYRWIVVLVFALFILKSRSIGIPRDKKTFFLFWSLFVIHIMLTYIYKTDVANTSVYGGMILLYLVSIVFVNQDRTMISIEQINTCFLIAGIFFIILFIFGERTYEGVRESLKILGTDTDPNEFSSYFIIFIPICIELFMQKKTIIQKLFLLSLIVASVYVLLMAASRGAIFALIITLFLFAWYKKLLSPRKLIVIALLFTFVFFVFNKYLVAYIPQSNLTRMTFDSIISDGGSNREIIWNYGLTTFFKSDFVTQLFGYGPYGLARKSGGLTLHNTFFQIMIDYGYIGLFYYLAMVIIAFRYSLQINKTYSAIFIGILAISFTLSFGPSYKIVWIMMFIFLLGFDEQREGNEVYENNHNSRYGRR